MAIARNQEYLNYEYKHNPELDDKPTLLLIHGLFSSLSALSLIERFFVNYNCLKIDLPNHGKSFYTSSIDFLEIAEEIKHLVDHLKIPNKLLLIGHSMGGKVAMTFAHLFPQQSKALVVLDIAPVIYGKRGNDNVIQVLNKVAQQQISDRREAQKFMASELNDENLASFLLKSFTVEEPHRFLFNTPLIDSDYISISGWKPVHVEIPTLFLYGGKSEYVNQERQQQIPGQFSNYQLIEIPYASHWIHVDGAPDFMQHLEKFVIANS